MLLCGSAHHVTAADMPHPMFSLLLTRRTTAATNTRGLDVAVLPGNNAPVAEFAAWACGQLGLQPKQVLFTEGRSYVLDEDMAAGEHLHLVAATCVHLHL